VKRLDALSARLKPGFSLPTVAALRHGASVFRTAELSAQPFGAALSLPQKCGDDCRDDHHESDDQYYFRCT
jgi:hypothetical protein